jgi:hypothetical protein
VELKTMTQISWLKLFYEEIVLEKSADKSKEMKDFGEPAPPNFHEENSE